MNKSYDRDFLIGLLETEIVRLKVRIEVATDEYNECARDGDKADVGEMDYLDKRIVRLAERKRKAQDSLAALRASTAETIEYGDWR